MAGAHCLIIIVALQFLIVYDSALYDFAKKQAEKKRAMSPVDDRANYYVNVPGVYVAELLPNIRYALDGNTKSRDLLWGANSDASRPGIPI